MRHQVTRQFQSEQDTLTSILRDAADSGTSPDEAITRVLHAVQAAHGDWEALFASALATVGDAAGQRLMAGWERDGLLPSGTTYDATRSGSQIADALSRGVPTRQAAQVVQTTHDALRHALSTTIDTGAVDDLITSLQDTYAAWQDGRVNSIADTTVVGGWSLGQLDAAFQAANVTGAQAVRTWTATLDAHTRPEHAAADGQQVGLSEPFDVGGEQLMYPGSPDGSPGNTINCRCDVSYDLQLTTGTTTGDTSADEGD